jgi:hypothetical protein
MEKKSSFAKQLLDKSSSLLISQLGQLISQLKLLPKKNWCIFPCYIEAICFEMPAKSINYYQTEERKKFKGKVAH